MVNKFEFDAEANPEILAVLGPFAPVPVYRPMEVQRAVSALTAAYVPPLEPIVREAVVIELAPLLVSALRQGTVKRRFKNTKPMITYAQHLKWAKRLIREALTAPRVA